MKPLSANAAAARAGKAKGTILSALKDGTLSGSKNTKGQWEIDPSELARVYSLKPIDQSLNQSEKPTLTAANDRQINSLQAVLDAKELVEVELRAQIEDLKEQRGKWQAQAERQTLLLEKSAPDSQKSRRGGLLSFLRGNG
jgi:hypothetical protein